MNWKTTFLVSLLLGALSQMPVFAADAPVRDRAALVNGAAITAAEFHTELNRLERQRGTGKNSPDPSEMARLKKEALESLITREILYQEALREGIKVPGAAVDAELNGLKKQFATGSEFTATLTSMGLSEASVRAQVEKGMAARRLIDEKFGKKVKVSDAEVGYYYEDHQDEFKVPVGKPATFTPLSEVREKIRLKIKQDRVDRELNPYLKRLREQAKVEIMLDEEGE